MLQLCQLEGQERWPRYRRFRDAFLRWFGNAERQCSADRPTDCGLYTYNQGFNPSQRSVPVGSIGWIGENLLKAWNRILQIYIPFTDLESTVYFWRFGCQVSLTREEDYRVLHKNLQSRIPEICLSLPNIRSKLPKYDPSRLLVPHFPSPRFAASSHGSLPLDL